jgi:hypothetical protein
MVDFESDDHVTLADRGEDASGTDPDHYITLEHSVVEWNDDRLAFNHQAKPADPT